MRNARTALRRLMCANAFGLCSLFLPLPAFAWVMSLLLGFLFADIGTVATVWGALLCVSHATMPAATAWWPALYALAVGCILMLPTANLRR